MTLIELMIAMTVLAVGLPACMLLLLFGMQANSRNKGDTASTVVDQEVIENFSTLKQYPLPGFVAINDCALSGGSANVHNASLAAGAMPAGSGAVMYTTGTAPTPSQVGDVDWTQPTPVLATSAVQGYAMMWQSCGGDIYEVRWNIQQVTTHLSLLTVSSRPQAAVQADSAGLGKRRAVLYARPTTLRTLIAN